MGSIKDIKFLLKSRILNSSTQAATRQENHRSRWCRVAWLVWAFLGVFCQVGFPQEFFNVKSLVVGTEVNDGRVVCTAFFEWKSQVFVPQVPLQKIAFCTCRISVTRKAPSAVFQFFLTRAAGCISSFVSGLIRSISYLNKYVSGWKLHGRKDFLNSNQDLHKDTLKYKECGNGLFYQHGCFQN